MVKRNSAMPVEVQREIETRVGAFNSKHLAKSYYKFHPKIQGKFIYLMYLTPNGELEHNGRLKYDGDLENMDFAIYKYSSEKYDSNEWFPGIKYANGTIEGGMKACLEAYPAE